jgi:NAD-dependent SIR2 family protein deacetylase
MKEVIDAKEIPKCASCGGLVKPDIVFFGEALPMRFFERRVDLQRTGTPHNYIPPLFLFLC